MKRIIALIVVFLAFVAWSILQNSKKPVKSPDKSNFLQESAASLITNEYGELVNSSTPGYEGLTNEQIAQKARSGKAEFDSYSDEKKRTLEQVRRALRTQEQINRD